MADFTHGTTNGSGSAPEGSDLQPIAWAVETGAVDEVLRVMDLRLQRRRQRRRRLAGAVAAVLVLGVVTVGWLRRPGAAATLVSAPPTAVVALPERRELADGSVVELRAGAEFVVAFTEAERRVLLSKGEARFQVAKNPARPFIVQAGGVLARAVGTAFLVQVSPQQVEVIVTEGRVQVSAPSSDTPPALNPEAHAPLLVPGERAVVSQPTAFTPTVVPVVSTVSAPQLSERLAWLAPRLEFSATPLAEAVRLINQYSAVKLTVADAALESVRLSGLIRADNVETFWRLLEEDYGLRVEHRSPTEVVLHAGRN